MVADVGEPDGRPPGQAAHLRPGDIRVSADYLGGGYGVVGDLEREAIRLMARAEGVLLDPVYTGRAFGGLLDLLRRPNRASPAAEDHRLLAHRWQPGAVCVCGRLGVI